MKIAFLFLAILSLIISSVWAFKSNFELEPILAVLGSIGTLLGLYIYDKRTEKKELLQEAEKLPNQQLTTTNVVSPVINISNAPIISEKINVEKTHSESKSETLSKSEIIELMKPKTHILFVDDDTKFQLVKILKDSGWRNTSTIKDIKNLDIPQVRSAHILFIDIHGVGKVLNCSSEGLDLAQMTKEKYPEKKVVIYSAESQGSIFHKAWGLADYKLEKNALPYQFESIIENISVGNYNKN